VITVAPLVLADPVRLRRWADHRGKRRLIGTTERQAKTAYAVTDLRAEQATAKKIAAARARAHGAIENTVHRTKDVTFSEGAAGQVRHHSPVVVSGLRGPARATLHRDGGSASPADDVLASNPKRSPALRGIR
jgi:hypothetical protein